jgi:hypothetical protein
MATGVAGWTGSSDGIGGSCPDFTIVESELQDINTRNTVKKAILLNRDKDLCTF